MSVTTNGLRMNIAPATAWATPRRGECRTSSSRTMPHAPSASSTPSHSRWTTHMDSPAPCPAAKKGAIGNR